MVEAERHESRGSPLLAPCGATDERQTAHSRLTPRENEVLRLASAGLSNRQIADALSLSDHTVLGYLKHVFTKLGVHSKLQAVMAGIAEGLIPMPTLVLSDDAADADDEDLASRETQSVVAWEQGRRSS